MTVIRSVSQVNERVQHALTAALTMVNSKDGRRATLANVVGLWESAKQWRTSRAPAFSVLDVCTLLVALQQVSQDIMANQKKPNVPASERERLETLLDEIIEATQLLAEQVYEGCKHKAVERMQEAMKRGIAGAIDLGLVTATIQDQDGTRTIRALPEDA